LGSVLALPYRTSTELRAFYRGLGQWLAVMRLLGGSDLHAENLIAAGPVPVVVDCETLFTPQPARPPSGYGLAVDRAAHLIGGSVLRSGLLPGRGVALGPGRDRPPRRAAAAGAAWRVPRAGLRIWCWLLLRRLGAVGEEAVRRARALAEQLPAGVAADTMYEVLGGMAGAVVPLLRLSECDDDPRWPALAGDIAARLGAAARFGAAARLGAAARHAGGLASWPKRDVPAGPGRLRPRRHRHRLGAGPAGRPRRRCGGQRRLGRDPGAAVGRGAAGRLAEAAFGYEQSLYDPGLAGWRDLRVRDRDWAAASWCHGAGGIGIAAADLLRRTGQPRWAEVLRRAAARCWSAGMGWNHTLCHGDMGSWEVVRAAVAAGLGPEGIDRDAVDSYVLASVAEFGPVSGLTRDAFSPGLMPGIGGVAYQLLRMYPDCRLPSVLLPDPSAAGG